MRYTVYSVVPGSFILFFTIMLVGCSGLGTTQYSGAENLPEASDKEAWNERFSSSRYITAWGVSNQSPQLAEQDARASVAAAVRSSIESELVMEMQSESFNGKIEDYQKLESKTKTRTYFEHAELIKTVPQTAHEEGGNYWVMASLSRQDAVEELLIPYNREAAPFRLLAARLDSLKDDLPAFTTTWNNLQTHQKNRLLLALEIRPVAGGLIPEIVADNSLYQNAVSNRFDLLNNLQIIVSLEKNERVDDEELTSRITTALVSLGLSVHGENCSPKAIHLSVRPQFKWTNVLGRVVQLELDGELGECEKETSWTAFQISDPRMRGEGRRPLEDLFDRMDEGFFEEHLRRILKPYLPI